MRLPRAQPLLEPDRVGILDVHVQGDDRVVVEVVAFARDDATRPHVLGDGPVVVVLRDVVRRGPAAPLAGEPLGHGLHGTLVAAAVPDEHDVVESVGLEALRHVREDSLERLAPQADRAGAPHVARLRLDPTFGDELEHRRAQRVAEGAGDRVAVGAEHVVVLARHQPRTVRLDPAGRNDGRRLPGRERVADVHPRHLLDPHGVGRGKRVRRVGAIVDVRPAVTAAHGAGVRGRTLPAPATAGELRTGRSRQGAAVRDGRVHRLGGLVRPEFDDLPTEFEGLHAVRDRHAVDGGETRRDPLVVAQRVGVVHQHVERDDRIVVDLVVPGLLEPAERHEAGHGAVVVVLLHVGDDRAVPHGVEPLRHVALAGLVAAAVTDEQDVAEAVHLEAVRDVGQERLEGRLCRAQRSGARHVAAGRLDRTFRDQFYDRRTKRVAELTRDRLAVGAEHVVVLAGREPRAVGLDTAGRDDDGLLAVRERVADVHPGHLLDPHGVGGRKGIGRVGAVVHVLFTVAAAHRDAGSLVLRGHGGARQRQSPGQQKGAQGAELRHRVSPTMRIGGFGSVPGPIGFELRFQGTMQRRAGQRQIPCARKPPRRYLRTPGGRSPSPRRCGSASASRGGRAGRRSGTPSSTRGTGLTPVCESS